MIRRQFAVALIAIGLLWVAAPSAAGPVPAAAGLEIGVPFEPTAFPSGGHTHLLYDLHLKNTGQTPLTLRRIEVFDAGAPGKDPIAVVEGDKLKAALQALDQNAKGDLRELAAGGVIIAYMGLDWEPGARVPQRLRHRVVTADSAAEGALTGTHRSALRLFGPPVEGADWLGSDAPNNDPDNHHRRGAVLIDGQVTNSRRFAIDWLQQTDSGAMFRGDAADKAAYLAYGKPLLAVGVGRVVAVKDGYPDNVPRHDGIFKTAVPLPTMVDSAGNYVILDLGGGLFAHYYHVQPASLLVKAGDRVRRGQPLARVGGSGDARAPHVHFEVTTSPKIMVGEGVPYLIDRYTVVSGPGSPAGPRRREMPMRNMVVSFPKAGER